MIQKILWSCEDEREEPEMFNSQCVYHWCGRWYTENGSDDKDNGSDDGCDDYNCYYGNDDSEK